MDWREFFADMAFYLFLLFFFLVSLVGLIFTPLEAYLYPGVYLLGLFAVGMIQWIQTKIHPSRKIDPRYCIRIM
jgi:hypothetical protein